MSRASHRRGRLAGLAVLAAGLCLGPAGTSLAASPNTWRAAAPLAAPRLDHVAVRLSNGGAFVAGGTSDLSTPLKSAAAYDPATDSWTPLADMGTTRVQAAGVALPGNRVLVVGGNQSITVNALNTGEVYSLVGNAWTPVSNTMSSPRGQNPTVTLLQNGKVLIAGGGDLSGTPVATADLYDPATNTFTPTGSMGTARALAAATLLPNGKVLVAGGLTGASTVSDTGDVYDPATGTWTPTANAMSAQRAWGSADTLPNGKVLVAGGESVLATSASTDLYDAATNRFTPGPAMNVPRALFGTSVASGGLFAVSGYFVTNGYDNVDPRSQFYNPATNAWVSIASTLLPKAQAPLVRLDDGDLLFAGGSNDTFTGTTDVELFTPPALPGAPGDASATASDGSAAVAFAPPASDGGLPVLRYTVTASTGQTVSTSDARTAATVTGLTNGKSVTFTVTATNAMGTGPASAPTSAVTPTAPPTPPVTVPAPKLKITGLTSKLTLAAFLKGVRFTVMPDRSASLQVSLLGSVNRATIARAYPLVLATKSFGRAAKKRTLTISPAKRLVGRPRKATVQLLIVATGSTGRQSTITKQLTITR